MAANLNKVLLIGNLTRDPELRYIPSGSAVATFTVAVNRVYKDQAGEKKEQVSFIRVVVWGRRAEVCGEYLSKGSPIFVEGRLQSREWETQEGQKRSTVEVVADNVQFLRGAAKQGAPGQRDTPPAPEEIETINLGEEQAAPGNNTKKSAGTGAQNTDEEVPF
ncbi:MAG: single-stranded DNA-binding protein [Candidatus Omnitrophica bacterium]|nr:single-stranded DNA-binding protein [Candidatus Omnitrophota bacterium]MDD5436971.1 single-stranded DNA-binding protein [Candidatus Omnitrophota bacterium]